MYNRTSFINETDYAEVSGNSLDYAGLAQLCARSPIMRKIMRAHNRIIQRSLLVTLVDSMRGGSPYSIANRRIPELIPVLGSQPAGDMSHKPGGRLPLFFTRPAVTLSILKRATTSSCLVNRGTMGMNSWPKTVARQRHSCDLNPGPSLPEFNMLTTRQPSHRAILVTKCPVVCGDLHSI